MTAVLSFALRAAGIVLVGTWVIVLAAGVVALVVAVAQELRGES